MSSLRKRSRRERKNVELSNLFISPQKVTVVFQLTIHSGLHTSQRLPRLCLFHFSPPPPHPPLTLPCFQNQPCQFNVTPDHLFSFSSFPLFISLHFLSQSNIHMLVQPFHFFFLCSVVLSSLSCFFHCRDSISL